MSFAAFQQLFAYLGLMAAFGIGNLLLGIAILRDMKHVLKSTNDNAIFGNQNKLRALENLKEFIKLHGKAKELSVIHYTIYNWQMIFSVQNREFFRFACLIFAE